MVCKESSSIAYLILSPPTGHQYFSAVLSNSRMSLDNRYAWYEPYIQVRNSSTFYIVEEEYDKQRLQGRPTQKHGYSVIFEDSSPESSKL